MNSTTTSMTETVEPMKRRREPMMVGAVLVLLVAWPFLNVGQYGLHLAILAMVYAIGASGLTGLMGYCGQYSLAQGAFLGVGAYTAAVLTTKFGVPGYATLPLSMAVAAACGILLGIPSLRLSGHFLAITTIAFQVIASLIFSQWYAVTNGQIGIDNIPSMLPAAITERVSPQVAQYYLVLIVCVLAIALVRQLLGSRLGRVWLSIQGDELLAKSLGLNTTRSKLTAFALSAAYGGAAGALLAQYMGNTHPAEFTLSTSITLLAMVLIGGRRAVYGAPLGAVILTLLPEVLRSSDELRLIIYGLMIIIVCKFAPFGLLGGEIARRSQSRT